MKLKVVIVDLEIPPRVKKWWVRVGIPTLVLFVAAVALAAPVTFTPGETLTAAALAAGAPSCDPNFTLDDQGHKHWKPECFLK